MEAASRSEKEVRGSDTKWVVAGDYGCPCSRRLETLCLCRNPIRTADSTTWRPGLVASWCNSMTVTEQPRHTAAVMFTDIEGSVRHWETAGQTFALALELHNRLVHGCVARNGGSEESFLGDGFLFVFPEVSAAVRAGVQIQEVLAAADWPPGMGPVRARVAVHFGDMLPLHGSVVGPTINLAARLLAAAHGGQTLVSEDAAGRVGGDLLRELQLVALGVHRLRDIAQPQRIHLAARAGVEVPSYVPLRTLDTLPTNLPVEVDEFVGRDAEFNDLNRLLSGGDARLVTIVGPGGVGKTRLVTRLGLLNLDNYPDGVWLVELADVTDPAGVAPAIAAALRMPHLPSGDDPLAALSTFLASRTCLLLLDNYEQVVTAATIPYQLVRSARGLTCIVTSRERLRVPGERVYELKAMELPDRGPGGEDIGSAQSVRLFLSRATQARNEIPLQDSDMAGVGEVCCLLDGLPLALELAAAQLAQMTMTELVASLGSSPSELAGDLRALPRRHQSVAATIQWSRALLDPEEGAVFDCLGVFRGGFFASAVAAVSEVADAETKLRRLRDQCLVQATDISGLTRYSLLPLVRDYCLHHAAPDLETLRECAARFYVRRAAELQIGTRVRDSQWALAELDNLRAALVWARERGEARALADIVVSLWPLFNMVGAGEECVRWQEAAVRALEELGDEAGLARALIGLGVSRKLSGDPRAALALLERSTQIARKLDLPYCLRWAHMERASALAWLGERDQAREALEESLATFRQSGDKRWSAECLRGLARLARENGDSAGAITRLQDALPLEDPTTEAWGVSNTLHELGQTLMAAGDLEGALPALKRAIELGRQVGDQPGLVLWLNDYARAALRAGDRINALASCEEALTLARRNAPQLVADVLSVYAECGGHQ